MGKDTNGGRIADANDEVVTQLVQPYILRSGDKQQGIYYNIRKMSELPHHLILLNDVEDLKKHVLLNLHYLYAKVETTSVEK